MVENWIERDLFSYFCYHYEDGTVERNLRIFGVLLILPKRHLEDAMYFTGCYMSLYHLVGLTKPLDDDILADMRRTKCFPILKLLLGGHVENEEPDYQSAYNTQVDGKRYTIQRVQRWTSYKHFRRWLSIKGTWNFAYLVTSEEDNELPKHSFASPAWIEANYTPSPEQIVHQAKKCWALTQQLHNDLEAMGFKRQANDDNKDQK